MPAARRSPAETGLTAATASKQDQAHRNPADKETGGSPLDRRLGARVAWGACGTELLDWLDEQGHAWLLDSDDALVALTGGLAIRCARLERALANLQPEVAA